MPPNVIIDSWFPQPSVIPQVDAVIHHGGNNSFTECLYLRQAGDHHALCLGRPRQRHPRRRRPAMASRCRATTGRKPTCWRSSNACLTDPAMKAKLAATSKHMQSQNGPEKAAGLAGEDCMAEPRSAPHLHEASTAPISSTGASSPTRSKACPARPAGSFTRDRATGPRPASGSARRDAGGCPSRATSSATSSPAARPTGQTTAR